MQYENRGCRCISEILHVHMGLELVVPALSGASVVKWRRYPVLIELSISLCKIYDLLDLA